MRKNKTFAKIIFITLVTAFLFSVSASYATNTQSQSDEIERIEYGENLKKTYLKNGTTLVEIFSQITSITTLTTTVTPTPISTEVFQPISTLENTKLIIEIVYLSALIVTTILFGLFGRKIYIGNKKELKDKPYSIFFKLSENKGKKSLTS